MRMDVRITWENGQHETCSWDRFAAANAEAYGADDLKDMRRVLELGGEVSCGGGATPLVTLNRTHLAI
jgi:hypothetical protein